MKTLKVHETAASLKAAPQPIQTGLRRLLNEHELAELLRRLGLHRETLAREESWPTICTAGGRGLDSL